MKYTEKQIIILWVNSLQKMLDRIKIIKQRYDEVSDLIIQPEIITDKKRYAQLGKEYKDLGNIIQKGEEYKLLLTNIKEAKEIIEEETDSEMIEMAKTEIEESTAKIRELEEEIKFLLIPKNLEDSKNAVIELRAGTGGDEASIFAGDLFRMYSKYSESKGWKVDVIDFSEGTNGGFKEIQFEVLGEDVYKNFKYEAGVHRVQRVPQTEAQGRVHTSAATCVVFPEAEDLDVEINPKDVKIDFFCSSGPGGQSVNTTYSAVRLTHIPTGLTAQCQDQKSQHKNKEKAFKVLRSRMYDLELAKRQEEDSTKRNSMVSSGDRSVKIRTYNYPQGRVTDHRIGLNLYDLPNIINGNIQKIIDELMLIDNTEKLKELGDQFFLK